MVKKIPSYILAALLLLSGCAADRSSENTPPSESEYSANSAGISDSTGSTDGSGNSGSSDNLSSSSSLSGTSAPASSSTPEESAPKSHALPEGFRLSDYISEFDDVKPMEYTVTAVNDSTCGQALLDKAVEVYESSDYYDEALETACVYFHIEGGELIPNTDVDDNDIEDYRSIWGYGLSVNDNEIEIETTALCGVTAKFDGAHDESIVVLSSYMPRSFFEWSGAGTEYFPVVYINGNGDASVLGTLSKQTLGAVDMIEFADGTIHLMVSSGHTTGTARCYIVSFKNGKPVCELVLSAVLCEDGIFYGCPYPSLRFPFFYDGEEYRGVSGVKPSRELADMICGDTGVLEAVPDAQEEYDNGTLFIIGGKYITFAKQDVTFTVNGGVLEKCSSTVYHSDGNFFNRVSSVEDTEPYDLGDEIKLPLYNILLDRSAAGITPEK